MTCTICGDIILLSQGKVFSLEHGTSVHRRCRDTREKAKAEEREACASEIDEMVEHGIPHAEFPRRLRARGEVKPKPPAFGDPLLGLRPQDSMSPEDWCREYCPRADVGLHHWKCPVLLAQRGGVKPAKPDWKPCGSCELCLQGDGRRCPSGAPVEVKTTEQHPECSICRRRHGREVEHACE